MRRLLAESGFLDDVLRSVLAALDRDAEPERTGAAGQQRRFGARYEIIGPLGQGGMGSVHVARDAQLGRLVALKQIRSELLASAEARERFELEAKAVSSLDHEHVCRVHDFGEHDGVPFLVMQLVEGETLAARIARARESGAPVLGDGADRVRAIVEFVEKVARAIHHAHERGLLHRDLKPANVMVRHDGDPVVLDFGLARVEAVASGLTRPNAAPGTREYMSPEQIQPGAAPLDRRTDIYSLGVVLYETLTLERPFAGSSEMELFQRILREEPAPPQRLNGHISRDLAIVIATAMEKDRVRRYASAAAFADDLRRARNREPIHARRASTLLRLTRWSQRNPVLATFLVLVTAGLAAVSWLYALADDRLTRFELVRSAVRLENAKAKAARLYPAWPERITELRAWLRDDAEPLVAALPQLRARVASLRPTNQPYPEDRQRNDRETHARAGELEDLVTERDRIAGAVKKAEGRSGMAPDVIATLHDDVTLLDARIAALRSRVCARRSFEVADEAQLFLLNTLARLVEDLEVFAEDEVARTRERLSWAEGVERTTIGDRRHDWEQTCEAIRASPRYAGLAIRPQIDLVPIGFDRDSGLCEYAHPRSGTIPERDPANGRLRIDERSSLVFVLLPAGNYWRGAQQLSRAEPNYDAEADVDEGPVRQVLVPAFFISKYEMTQGQWKRLTGGKQPSQHLPGTWLHEVGDPVTLANPVERVSWVMCTRVLGEHALVLPSEEQWEYAARAGTSTPYWTGAERESLRGAVNIADRTAARAGAHWSSLLEWPEFDDGCAVHARVDKLRPNAFGLHHVLGNVFEWCSGWYDEKGHPQPGSADGGTRASGLRVYRGGCFDRSFRWARVSYRNFDPPDARLETVGVRPARTIRG